MKRPLAGLAACAALVTTGCTGMSGTGDQGYVSGDGQVATYASQDRSVVDISGDDLDGKPLAVADYRGKVVVLVVWGSWCGPCRSEVDDVIAAARQTADTAQFIGIDIRDSSRETAAAFVRSKQVPYPSIYDPDSKSLVDFPVGLSPKTIPAFAVLDRQGRVAATIAGSLPSTTTLVELVQDAAGPGTATSGGTSGATSSDSGSPSGSADG